MAERTLKLISGYMRGEDVKKVQRKLLELGFDLEVDGVYGNLTAVSVKKFQELVGIKADGIVGPVTREKLNKTTVKNFYPEVFKNIYESKNYSIEELDYYLSKFAHPDLKGHGKYFKQAEVETKIPSEWMLANAMQESILGKSTIAQKYYNLFGWGVPDSGLTDEGKFSSFADCILYVARKIKELFLNPKNWRYSGDNIFGIEKYYSTCPYNAIMKAKYYREICKFLDGDKNMTYNKDTQLTKNFRYGEFFCNGIEPPKEYFNNILKLATELQKVRDAVGKPIIITSGWRTKEHNKKVGGASSSQHLLGKAADVKISGIAPKFAIVYLAKFGNFNGFGIANTYTHVDIRDSKFAVWSY